MDRGRNIVAYTKQEKKKKKKSFKFNNGVSNGWIYFVETRRYIGKNLEEQERIQREESKKGGLALGVTGEQKLILIQINIYVL